MKRRSWIVALLLAVAVSGSVAWYFASPWYTLGAMRSAARAGDGDALAAYVDFSALRRDLKVKLRARMVAEAKARSGLGALGMALGAAMVGPAVDEMVTPATIRAAFAARRDEAAAAGASPSTEAAQRPPRHVVIRRQGLSTFLAVSREHPDSGLVFTRHGLGWRLSGILLSPTPDSALR
jgi:hypothetical protein